ncbi:MAG: hypothetical protein WC333_00275 [Dehalococcoidia bacterium]|jgi:hypothetical protein
MSLIPRFLLSLFNKKDGSEPYKKVVLNGSFMTKAQKELLKNCKKRLSDNNIPLNKIRFVLEPQFIYDIDNNTINPTYTQLIPKKRKYPIVEIGKPKNSMTVFLGQYQTVNNFNVIRNFTKGTKKGLVVLASEEDYNAVVWLANLDDAIVYYYTQMDDCNCED